MTNKYILYLILAAPLFAHSQTDEPSITFIDPETNTVSDVDVGDGLKAVVTLPLVPEHRHIDFEFLVFPEFKLDEVPLYQKKNKEADSDVSGKWQKTFRIPSFRDKEEIIARFGRVARLRISWKNAHDGTEGTLIRKFYLLESKDQKFFKLLEPGELRTPTNADPESVCSYRKNLEIVGPFLQNPSLSPQEYEFSQSVAYENLRYRGPLNAKAPDSLGYPVAPIFQAVDSAMGWLMTGWTHFEGKETKLSFKPKIVLQPAQGGYFLKETIVKRFKAQKYSYKRIFAGHSEWQAASTGLLDVGVPQYDFVTLTFEDSQDPAKVERLLTERSATMTSCPNLPSENDRVYHTAPTNTLNEEMYFTEL